MHRATRLGWRLSGRFDRPNVKLGTVPQGDCYENKAVVNTAFPLCVFAVVALRWYGGHAFFAGHVSMAMSGEARSKGESSEHNPKWSYVP